MSEPRPTSAVPEPVIELIDADVPSRFAPDTLSLASVNWRVEAGEFWVIGGLGGSGKTDLLCTMAGLARPARGALKLFGEEVTVSYDHDHLAERLRVAMVFGERGRLLSHLSVRQNIALPLEYHQTRKRQENVARVEQLMELTETVRWADCVPSEISPAWARRVALARALALKPSVVLLDNPLAGLDPRHAEWWVEFLRSLWRGHAALDEQPATLVVAATDFRPWHIPGQRLAVLDNTRLVALDEAGTSLEDPAASALTCLLSWTYRST
jgi:ABC-type transporter Mla maintaining outer membrane lipid asymmetry ATPase subunit MlaF